MAPIKPFTSIKLSPEFLTRHCWHAFTRKSPLSPGKLIGMFSSDYCAAVTALDAIKARPKIMEVWLVDSRTGAKFDQHELASMTHMENNPFKHIETIRNHSLTGLYERFK